MIESWIVMLIMDLIVPIAMIGFGKMFVNRPPKNINDLFGYRTAMSMKNRDTWEFAHRYCGKLWFRLGLVLLVISVPLLLKVYPTTGFSIEVGPELSYILSTSPDMMTFKSTAADIDRSEINIGECKGLNVGVAAGVAYDFEMGLTLGARYTYGFTDMAKNLKWKPSNIQVTIGWMF